MKLIPMNYHYLRYPIKKFLDKVESSPFGSIDPYRSAPQLNIFDYSLSRLIKLGQDIGQRDLKIMAMTPGNCVYPVNFYTQDPVTRQSSIRYCQRAIDTAKFLGCPNIQISVGFGYFDQLREEAWKYCRESPAQLAVYYQRKQARLLLEELKATTTNVLITSRDIVETLDEISSPYIVGMVSMGQTTYAGETVNDYFSHLGEWFMYIRSSDREHTIPGHGDFPTREHHDVIERRGYDGTVSLEIRDRRYYCSPDRAIDDIVSWVEKNTHELGDVIEEIRYVNS